MAGLQSLDVDRPGIWSSNEEGYVNSLEEVKEIIESYEKKTMSHFVVYSSNASFSNTRGIPCIYNMHWLVSTVFNGEITVYDSLKPTMPSALSLQHVYGDKSGEPVRVKVYMCQKQNAESDCGFFAIANALALAKGVSLKTVVFSQLQMRS